MCRTPTQIIGETAETSTVESENAPRGTHTTAAKRKIHVIDRIAPFRMTTSFEAATYMPYESELNTIRRSPSVDSDENEALFGSIRSITPRAPRTIPTSLFARSH